MRGHLGRHLNSTIVLSVANPASFHKRISSEVSFSFVLCRDGEGEREKKEISGILMYFIFQEVDMKVEFLLFWFLYFFLTLKP